MIPKSNYSKEKTPFPGENGVLALLLYIRSVNNEFLDLSKKLGSVVGMSLQLNRLREIKAENTHNGLSVYCVSSRNKVNVIITLRYDRHKALDIVDSTQHYCSLVHNLSLQIMRNFTYRYVYSIAVLFR